MRGVCVVSVCDFWRKICQMGIGVVLSMDLKIGVVSLAFCYLFGDFRLMFVSALLHEL